MNTIIMQSRQSGKAWASRKRIIYLAGPMTGLPEFNYPEFHRVTAKLRAAGHTVYNPAEYPYDGPLEAFPLRAAFAEFTRFICTEACTIVLLPGWRKSIGATAECSLGAALKLDLLEWESVQDSPSLVGKKA